MPYVVRLMITDNITGESTDDNVGVVSDAVGEQIERMFRDLRLSASPLLMETGCDPLAVSRMQIDGISVILAEGQRQYTLGLYKAEAVNGVTEEVTP